MLKKYDALAKDLEQEYNNACEEGKEELFQQLEVVDEAVKTTCRESCIEKIFYHFPAPALVI